jgi:hypothetical protein
MGRSAIADESTIDVGEPLRGRGRRDRLGQWHARYRRLLVTLQRPSQLHEGDSAEQARNPPSAEDLAGSFSTS